MFKKAKQKIVLSILSILAAVLVGTLGMIYISSYLSATSQNYRVLERQMELFTGDPQTNSLMKNDEAMPSATIGPQAEDKPLDFFGEKRGREKIQRNLEVGTFYELKIYKDGSIEVVRNGANGLYTDEELMTFASEVSSKNKGKRNNLLYMVTEKNDIKYVCFMDNTIFSESFTRLFLFTLLFGLIAMVAITFISIYIANRIVSPMEESYKKQKQFTADAGHELKTPVSVVATNLELLKRELGENVWLDNISYENERMRVLITKLLELARNENQKLDRKVTDLSHLVQGAILPYEAVAYEKNILIDTDIIEGVKANVNEKSIEQFTAILLDNAISHIKKDAEELGKVKVEVFERKGNAIISVSNRGDEIPKEERKKLFERFYRADSSHEYTGHYGLGLAIAKAIADANHGRIEVKCEEGQVVFSGCFPCQ